MILGSIRVEGDAVVTHRDSYLLGTLSVVSVRRPFFAVVLQGGLASAGFAFAFADLLYPGEIVFASAFALAAPLAASQVGQLKLLSRDLRGSELSGVVWGFYGRLNRIRGEIVSALRSGRAGGAP